MIYRMPETDPENTDDFDDELEVVEDIDIPKVKLNKNGTARKPLSPEQRERNLENLAKAREKARLQKLALSSKSKTEQDEVRKQKAKQLAETKKQKLLERQRLDAEIEKFKNKPVEKKPVGKLKDQAKPPVEPKEEEEEEVIEPVKKPVKKPKKKVIIVEHSSSDSEDEHVIIKTRKKKRMPVAVAPAPAPAPAPVVYMPPPPPPPPPMSDEDKKKKLAYEADQRRKNNLLNAIFR